MSFWLSVGVVPGTKVSVVAQEEELLAVMGHTVHLVPATNRLNPNRPSSFKISIPIGFVAWPHDGAFYLTRKLDRYEKARGKIVSNRIYFLLDLINNYLRILLFLRQK